jgi:P27 family predicted phage terminase small subunit
MGKRGPPKTPLLLQQLHGNPRDHAPPVDVPEGRGELWAAPPWFDDEQRLQWDYALENAPLGLLTGSDREVLVIWCVASVEHARAVQEVRKLGQVVKTKDGNAIQNPFLPIVNKQALIMLRAGAEMGFSPASRVSLGNLGAELIPGGGRYVGASRAGRSRGDLEDYLDAKPDKLDS